MTDRQYQKVLSRLLAATPSEIEGCQAAFDEFVLVNPGYKVPKCLLRMFTKPDLQIYDKLL